jgi:MYXO-CTERM domain-containing protein
MTARTFTLALALAAALGPAAARAQWRTEPMPVRLAAPGLDVLAGAFVTPGQDDLLVVDQTARTAQLRRHHALLSTQASPFPLASMNLPRALRSGTLRQNGTDGLADVASHYGVYFPSASQIQVVFGSAPGTMDPYGLPSDTSWRAPPDGDPYVASFVRLLPTSPPSQQLVLPYCLDDYSCPSVFLMDFGTGALPAATTRKLDAVSFEPLNDSKPEAFPVWVSTTARTGVVDDVAIGVFGTVLLYAHRSPAAGSPPTLAGLDLTDPIAVGTTRPSNFFASRPDWLPITVPRFSDVHGVATLDVDQDGIPDLVFTMSTNPNSPLGSLLGSLVWVKGTGNPADFANPLLSPWHDLGAHKQLLLPDPRTVRPLQVNGQPAIAVWDRVLQEVLVVTSNVAAGSLDVWRAPAPGRFAKDIRLADLVGSPAQDLVVVMDQGTDPGVVLVYADLGLPAPELGWAPGSPGSPARGVPTDLGVLLEPGSPTSVTVEWIQGVPTNAPVGTGFSHVFPPDCSMPPPPLQVVVRATDDTGQFDELFLTTSLAALSPGVALRGSAPPGRLVLVPGGTTAVFDATAATSCAAATWGGSAWPASASVVDATGPTWMRRTVTLPEAAYPALLADPAFAVSLATTDPGASPAVASLPIALDGSGLVEVTHASDRATLAEGELAVLRTRLRSRLSVPLPGVRVVDALRGIVATEPPSVTGAHAASVRADGADLVLDALPPSSTEVTITLAVRGTGSPGESYVAARSSAGWPLTPEAQGQVGAVKAPGCGCAAGSAPGWLALFLVALALRPRRRPT